MNRAEWEAQKKMKEEAQAEVQRLREDFKGLVKSLQQQLPHCKDKEMIEWIIEKIQELIQ